MTDKEQLTEALLARDHHTTHSHDWLATILEREQLMEQRVRRVAVGAWSATAAFVVLLGVSIFMIRVVADGWTRDLVRCTTLITGVLTILAIVLAILTTIAWLFRFRSGSLAAIERRLAALEELLTRRNP